jgi:transcription antitermination factor NusG
MEERRKHSAAPSKTKKYICVKQPMNEMLLLKVTKFPKVLGVMTFE